MTITAGQFQTIANKFMNTTFAAVRKSLTLRLADAPVYGSPQTYTTEAGFGIELSIDQSKFDGDQVQVGDFLIFTNASDWTTNPRSDNVDCVFNGDEYQIINVDKDADNAAYFLQVRAK